MAFQTIWYNTKLPEEVIELIERDLTEQGTIPSTHWVAGMVWHYVNRANRENFTYNLSHLDGDSIKFKTYNEGDEQSWHVDADPSLESDEVRKISFTIQLSGHDDYEGGNVEMMDEGGNKYFIPRERGIAVLFDSRTQHRVRQVTKGTRKSLVGWCVGPQWS